MKMFIGTGSFEYDAISNINFLQTISYTTVKKK